MPGFLDAGADIIEHRRRVPARLGEFRIEPLAEGFLGRAQGRRGFDPVEKGERMIERLLAERAALVGVGLERARLRAQRLDLPPQLVDHPAIRRAASSA